MGGGWGSSPGRPMREIVEARVRGAGGEVGIIRSRRTHLVRPICPPQVALKHGRPPEGAGQETRSEGDGTRGGADDPPPPQKAGMT